MRIEEFIKDSAEKEANLRPDDQDTIVGTHVILTVISNKDGEIRVQASSYFTSMKQEYIVKDNILFPVQ